MVYVEAVLTQLVFEHSLRIRLHASNEESDTMPAGDPPSIQASSKTDLSEVPTNVAVKDTTINGGTTETFGKAGVIGDKDASRSLVGTMTNLLTTDLAVLKAPGRFVLDLRVFLTTSSYYLSVQLMFSSAFAIAQMIISVVFLWNVLGWRCDHHLF